MALASSTFSIDFSGLSNANPYTNPLITVLNGTAQIESGVYRPNTLSNGSPPQRFVYSGSVSGTTWRVSMRVNNGGNYNKFGVGFINPATGNGYAIEYQWGSIVSINRIDSDVVTGISLDTVEITPDGLSVNAILHLDLDLATGDLAVLYEDPNATIPITTPTAVVNCVATDTTYTSGLKPAIVFLNEDADPGSFLLKAWGADAGGGGTPGNASGDVGTASAVAPSVSASSARSVSVTLRNGSGALLNTVTRRFWTRATLDAAAVDGGAGGLSVACNSVGVFTLTGLNVGAGAGWLTYKDPSDDLNCHVVPVTFV